MSNQARIRSHPFVPLTVSREFSCLGDSYTFFRDSQIILLLDSQNQMFLGIHILSTLSKDPQKLFLGFTNLLLLRFHKCVILFLRIHKTLSRDPLPEGCQ